MEGAGKAAKPLKDLGYQPYITRQAPFRIWVGVFRERKDTEQLKQELKDKGFGSFTGSVVINGGNLQYGKGREIFIKEITPLLKAYTTWLKENLILFGSGTPGSLNFSKDGVQPTVLEEVYREVQVLQKEVNSNSETMNKRFANVNKSIGDFNSQFNTFMEEKDYREFVMLQYRLLGFIDNYLLLWQEIDNINKS